MKYSVLLYLVLIVFVVSCSNSSNPPPPPPTICESFLIEELEGDCGRAGNDPPGSCGKIRYLKNTGSKTIKVTLTTTWTCAGNTGGPFGRTFDLLPGKRERLGCTRSCNEQCTQEWKFVYQCSYK